MPNISLTEFIDFVASSGTPRLTKVRQIKCKGDYDPRTDFWKLLRDAIRDFHVPTNTTGKKEYFENFLNGMQNPEKRESYRPVVKNYISFLGRKQIITLPMRKTTWTHNDLEVRINPELHLSLNGETHLYKLYFKAQDLSKTKTDAVLAVMGAMLGGTTPVDYYGILDVKHNKNIRSATPNESLLVLLRGEADGFVSMWNEIQC